MRTLRRILRKSQSQTQGRVRILRGIWSQVDWVSQEYGEAQKKGRKIKAKGWRSIHLPPASHHPLSNLFRYFFSRKGLRRSMGTGKIVVEFFSVATSVRV